MAELSVTAAATPDVVYTVLDELDRLWERAPGVAATDRRRFETGLVEVLGNVVEHAYRPGAAGPDGRQLSVEVSVRPDAVEAVLSDHGQPVEVDLSAVTMPDAESGAESGRGLALALASLDRLAHERVGGRNRWTLRCHRS